MVIVFNIIGYITLLFTLTYITTLLIGDQLINILKLEIIYPKLAKYIKLSCFFRFSKSVILFYFILF